MMSSVRTFRCLKSLSSRKAAFSSTSSTTAKSGNFRRIFGRVAGVSIVVGGGLVIGMSQSEDFERTVYRAIIPIVQACTDAEVAHRVAVIAYGIGVMPKDTVKDDDVLKTTVWGRKFANPIGIAAGFDKNAEAVDGVLNGGAGFVEIGSVTPMPQAGNAKPRVFRLIEDGAVINRYGFNSVGVSLVKENLEARVLSGMDAQQQADSRMLAVNLGKNKTSTELSDDFVEGIITLGEYADFLVVNVSSPNTPGLRSLQGKECLHTLIADAQFARDSLVMKNRKKLPPLLIKVAPDLTDVDLEDIADVALSTGVDGLIVSNTTVSRPESLKSANSAESGGLSGRPLMAMSTDVLRRFYTLTKGKIPLIGVGGVSSGEDAYEKIKAGASLIEIYSSFALEGPHKIMDIKRELSMLLKRDGFSSVEQAVGVDHKK
eukprot:CFRG7783T1